MSDYYDREGNRISQYDWGAKFGDPDYKTVGRTVINDEVTVSTVWLGLDHNLGGPHPLIFETLVFGGEHDQLIYRYHTLHEAAVGHNTVVAMVRGDER